MEIEDLISIGFIKRPFGNDGFITVVPKNDFIEAFSLFKEFFVVWSNRKVRYKTVEKCRIEDHKIKLKFRDINSEQQAYSLRKATIMIAKDDLKLLKKEDFDVPNMVTGYKVFSYQNNKVYGTVSEIKLTAAHPILVISDNKDKEILIPYIENFVKKIDDEKEKIYIETIPGLIDAN